MTQSLDCGIFRSCLLFLQEAFFEMMDLPFVPLCPHFPVVALEEAAFLLQNLASLGLWVPVYQMGLSRGCWEGGGLSLPHQGLRVLALGGLWLSAPLPLHVFLLNVIMQPLS